MASSTARGCSCSSSLTSSNSAWVGSLSPIHRKSPGEPVVAQRRELVAEVAARAPVALDVDGLVHDHERHCVPRGAVTGDDPPARRRRAAGLQCALVAIVLLLRHGHSTANAQGVLAGWTEGVGLTDTGREQAARVAERLAPLTIARAVSSPLQRCLETASVALAGHDVGRDDRLGECHYGGWTGRSLAEAAKDDLWRVVQDDPGAATFPPDDALRGGVARADGGSGSSAGVRALDAEVEAEHGAHAVWVAVSHGDPIKAVVAEAVGAGLAGLQRVRVDPGSLTAVHLTADPDGAAREQHRAGRPRAAGHPPGARPGRATRRSVAGPADCPSRPCCE